MNEFSKYVKVNILPSLKEDITGKRVSSLLDDVIRRLPDEEQFKTNGTIWIYKRKEIIEFWNTDFNPGYSAPFENPRVDGHCLYNQIKNEFNIFIVPDGEMDFLERTDEYIIGVIAWEFGRLSYYWKITKKIQNEIEDQDKAAADEARRLGFGNELDELLICSERYDLLNKH